ncbi:MAG: Cof-type HAD-IIB family hydrolase [Treponema sp.]|nr:Cof-type HAD-IIB family hydrolase [Treponema sp.]
MLKKFDPKKIKGLALDLDGTTLLPDTSLGERTACCLKRLISDGVQVIIATGRSTESAGHYCAAAGAAGPMVFYNGAEVVDMPSGKIMEADFLDIDVADFGIDLAREMGLHYQIYLPANGTNKEMLLFEREGVEAEIYYRHTGTKPVVKDLKTAIAGVPGCIKAMYVVDSSRHDEIRRKMKERFGDRINIIRSSPSFLEILRLGVSKGKGLTAAMRLRGLKAEEVMAFGDEENDLSMFSVAGFSAAPSSAGEKIRAAADFNYGSVAEEGLAAFLEEYFLR